MNKGRLCGALVAGAMLSSLTAESAFEIGEAMSEPSFWTRDAVLFVQDRRDEGFRFTSDQREGADSRRDGAVTCFGLPVYETRVAFAAGGGVERVELTLFSEAGTEALRTFVGADGRRYARAERIDRPMSRNAFFAALKGVRARLTPRGKPPAATDDGVQKKSAARVQKAQTWPKTDLPSQATLTWCYDQKGKDVATFRPRFIRLAVDGPARLKDGGGARRLTKKVVTSRKISDNVVRDPRGDVFIDNLPMVDQGQKGYCAVATAERVLRYYGVDVDEHELATAAGTDAARGTTTLDMKKSVEAIGRKFRLGTIVCYGDFEKSVEDRIDGLGDEVRAYNKAAKKMKKPPITDDVYIRRSGDVVVYSPAAVDEAMDVEVRREMRVNGAMKSKYTKFLKDVRDQVAKGIPLFWGLTLGIYPEPDVPQAVGGHLRLIIGYNDRKKEILYTDSWGAGHELKRMPADWAWTVSHCLMYLKPLTR